MNPHPSSPHRREQRRHPWAVACVSVFVFSTSWAALAVLEPQQEPRAPRTGGAAPSPEQVLPLQPPTRPAPRHAWSQRYGPLELPQMPQDPNDAPLMAREPVVKKGEVPYSFYFSRIAYSGTSLWGYASWSVDFPKADRQFLLGVERLVETLDLYPFENAVLLDSEALRDYPFLYAVEVGHMQLSEAEQEGLRNYLLSGGFLMVDDFWGTDEWEHFEWQMSQVLPGYAIEPLPMDHPIFHTFYDIPRVRQVPNLGLARQVAAGISNVTWEKDGYEAEVLGIFDENRRLMVAVNWNCDLGDAWEWAESSEYPLDLSTYAYQIGVNTIVYALTH